MIRSKFYTLIILTLLGALPLSAQDCDECLAIPQELKNYTKASLMNKLYQDKTGAEFEKLTYEYRDSDDPLNYWRAYSDRVDNPLYIMPNGRKNRKNLGFMEQVYITGREGNWLKISVFEDQGGNLDYYEKGWMPASNLILNSYAVSNEKSITKKGLVLVNLDNVASFRKIVKAAEQGQQIKNYDFYLDPQTTVKKENVAELEIRYVLKELPGVKLLSRNDRIDNISEADRKYNVNGWMKNVNITDWDTRVCLEPTYGQTYADMYKEKDIPVFIEKSQLNSFVDNNIQKPVEQIYTHQIKTTRKPTIMMRMPILENIDGSDMKKVATLGSVSGKSSSEVDEVKGRAKEAIEELRTKRNNLNILFVVDATKSMDDFFPAVRRGIERIIALNQERYKKEMRFSIAVYRDYADGEKAFENLPLTDDLQEINNFLASIRIGSVGKAREEAVFNGMIEGIKRSRMNPDQSNVVVMIGDAGNVINDARGLKRGMVSDLLVQFNASLVTFQVYYGIEPAYQAFNDDAQELFYELGEKTDRKQSLKPNMTMVPEKRNTFELKFKDTETGELEYFVDAGFGRFIYANDNEKMPISVLQENLSSAIGDYLTELDEQIQFWSDKLRNGEISTKRRDEFDQANEANLREHLKNQGFTDDEIEVALQSFQEFSMSGFTSTKFYNKPLSCFAPVVFLSDEEVDNMIEVFEKVDPDANLTDSKAQVADALIAQTKAALGETSDDRVRQKSMSEIWGILLAVPFDEKGEYGTLRDVPIGEIPNSNHRSLPKFILQFQESVRRFNKKNLEQDRFRLNSQFYYWIPLEKIPGNG